MAESVEQYIFALQWDNDLASRRESWNQNIYDLRETLLGIGKTFSAKSKSKATAKWKVFLKAHEWPEYKTLAAPWHVYFVLHYLPYLTIEALQNELKAGTLLEEIQKTVPGVLEVTIMARSHLVQAEKRHADAERQKAAREKAKVEAEARRDAELESLRRRNSELEDEVKALKEQVKSAEKRALAAERRARKAEAEAEQVSFQLKSSYLEAQQIGSAQFVADITLMQEKFKQQLAEQLTKYERDFEERLAEQLAKQKRELDEYYGKQIDDLREEVQTLKLQLHGGQSSSSSSTT